MENLKFQRVCEGEYRSNYKGYEVDISKNFERSWAIDIYQPNGDRLSNECLPTYADCKYFAQEQIENHLSELEYKNWCADNFSEEEISFNIEQIKRISKDIKDDKEWVNDSHSKSEHEGICYALDKLVNRLVEISQTK